ncbi:MAG TPA: HupE/UreJ family protein, partial [Roseateles sp.]
LLLVAVWRREGKGWAPRASGRAALAETLKLVTAFTLAHSITLGLAASGAIDPPTRWIESLIALTVLLAALDNLRPFMPGPRWSMVGLFGLVHGVGFAGPLKDLGLRGGELVLPLLGFNLGVELGQLAVVALLLPLALVMRERAAYRRWIVPAGSSAVAMLALLWLAERSLGLALIS